MAIKHFANYHNPKCDGCGRMLAAEKSDEAAEAAMEAAGWERREGKDLCPLCLRRAKADAEKGEKIWKKNLAPFRSRTT